MLNLKRAWGLLPALFKFAKPLFSNGLPRFAHQLEEKGEIVDAGETQGC